MIAIKELNDAKRIDWIRLIRSENVGPATFIRLLESYQSADKALQAIPELSRRGGRMRPIKIPPRADAVAELEAAHKFGGSVLALCEPAYPQALRMIPDPPPVIMIAGHPNILSKDILAVVGARNASAAALRLTTQFVSQLGASGLVIASGMARGIDTAAHQASLETGTVAVVGGGMDVVYPKENQLLYERIREQGCLVAEQPMGVVPQARHFPRRNRIISGLALGVLVVEAAPRSGSLITARMALEQGREVFAIPGSPLDPRAKGGNNLIRSGAHLVDSSDDILDGLEPIRRQPLKEPELPFYQPSQSPAPAESELSKSRQTIIDLLSIVAVDINDIIRRSNLPAATVLTILLELELAGRIERHVGNRVSFVE